MASVQLGTVGVWTFALGALDGAQLRDTLAEIDQLGYGAVWFPGGRGESSFDTAGGLLSASSRLTVATGIVNIWLVDAATVAARSQALWAGHGDRFLLGLGVSHPEFINRMEPERYRRPLAAVGRFLDELDGAGVAPHQGRRILAALGPGMLRLSAERSAGAHPDYVPVEHTAVARQRLGPEPLLAPEQAVVLSNDPSTARQVARKYMALYLQLSNYVANLRRLGYGDDDLSGPSDRLVDAIVAWGDEEAVAGRVRQHLEAGADHVCVQVVGLTDEENGTVPIDAWRRLAPALTTVG